MIIVRSTTQDVYRNLAMEEYLTEHMESSEPILFLWQSDCAVVMGKNQNPWRECRLDLMRDEGVPLARRISGGGTVYHDVGNLNYCIIVDRIQYQEEQAFGLILESLASLGIGAEKTGKSNLSVEGRKFSGNAFSFRKGKALHHGTLLVHTDLARLNRYLGSMFDSFETHAVCSIPATVCNLTEFSAALTIDALSEALERIFCEKYGEGAVFYRGNDSFCPVILDGIAKKKRADEWLFGATPMFKVLNQGVALEVVKGIVVSESGTNVAGLVGVPFAELAFSL